MGNYDQGSRRRDDISSLCRAQSRERTLSNALKEPACQIVSSLQLVYFIRSGDEMLFDDFAHFSVGPG
jgi:hypothetical protein